MTSRRGMRPYYDDDVGLIAKALSGDREMLKKLVDTLLPVIKSSVWLACRDSYYPLGDEQDICQDVWTELFADNGRALRQYDSSRGMSLKSYVSMVTRREVGNLLQKAQTQKRSPTLLLKLSESQVSDVDFNTPDYFLENKVLLEKLLEWLQCRLSGIGVRILNETFLQDIDSAEAAIRLSIPKQVVYNWQHRIRTLSRLFIIQMDNEYTISNLSPAEHPRTR